METSMPGLSGSWMPGWFGMMPSTLMRGISWVAAAPRTSAARRITRGIQRLRLYADERGSPRGAAFKATLVCSQVRRTLRAPIRRDLGGIVCPPEDGQHAGPASRAGELADLSWSTPITKRNDRRPYHRVP